MLSKETLEQYRRMTNAERIQLTIDMMEASWPAMLEGPDEVVDRRFELLRRQNDERNQRMLEAFAKNKKRSES